MKPTIIAKRRRGFTLTELLVVMGIMAVLASLVAAAIQRVRMGQNTHNTESIVAKVQNAVDNQVTAISNGVVRERQTQTPVFQALTTFCNGDQDRAQALLMYCRVRQAFPQTTADLATFNIGGVSFPSSPAFAKVQTATGSANDISAALLYIAVTERTIQGYTFPVDDASGNAVNDIPLPGPVGPISCRVFLDAWKQPIGFIRWPVLAELNAPPYVNPRTSFDSYDPRGKLTIGPPQWLNQPTAQTVLGTTFSTTVNKQLVVYSQGPDLASPSDDILGFRLRSIGKRGGP